MNERLLIVLVLAAILLFAGAILYRSYTALSHEKAFLAMVASYLGGGVRMYGEYKKWQPFVASGNEVEMGFRVAATGVFIVFLTAFVFRLWGRWIGDRATTEERQTGAAGVGAWFSASNLFVGAVLVLTAWFGYDISPVLGTVVVAAALAAFPVLRMESPAPAPVAAGEDLSVEREKIVSMLEAGKLTPEESADLLQALGSSSSRAPQPRSAPVTGGQRPMLIGAALVAVGFFLPWFVINPAQELSRLMQGVQMSADSPFGNSRLGDVLSSSVGSGPNPSVEFSVKSPLGGANIKMPDGFPFGGSPFKTGSITIRGGDIQSGLGWFALGLALAAALVPYVATTLGVGTVRLVRLFCLGGGGFLLLYLVSQNLRLVGAGLVIAAVGYALEIFGAIQERRMVRA